MDSIRANHPAIIQFEKYSVAHPSLLTAYETVYSAVSRSVGAPVVLVYGPSGVGKTTLVRKLHREIFKENISLMNEDRGIIPIAGIEAPGPDSGTFNWKDFYYRSLVSLEEPMIDLKDMRHTSRSSAYGKRVEGTVLRRAFENALTYRQAKVFTIDEAEHMGKVPSGRKTEDQLDTLKSLANMTNTAFVLAGTYEMLGFRNLDGQLARRTINVHIPRYCAKSISELKIFNSVLAQFLDELVRLDQLTISLKNDLMSQWEFFYERSIGCIGTLKDWLLRSLQLSLMESNAKPLNMGHFVACALSVSQCETMAREAIEGELRIQNEEGRRNQLRGMLGLDAVRHQRGGITETEKSTSKATKPGVRKPRRDPVGEKANAY